MSNQEFDPFVNFTSADYTMPRINFTVHQLRDIENFRAFNREIANGHCSLCMKVLYPEEQKYRELSDEHCICRTWRIDPVMNAEGKYMVCSSHLKFLGTASDRRNATRATNNNETYEITIEKTRKQFVFPGKR